jgi:hypothetical protein
MFLGADQELPHIAQFVECVGIEIRHGPIPGAADCSRQAL